MTDSKIQTSDLQLMILPVPSLCTKMVRQYQKDMQHLIRLNGSMLRQCVTKENSHNSLMIVLRLMIVSKEKLVIVGSYQQCQHWLQEMSLLSVECLV